MFEWRITKYDPQFRDASGVFQKDEWTSISDIGELYSEREFSFKVIKFILMTSHKNHLEVFTKNNEFKKVIDFAGKTIKNKTD